MNAADGCEVNTSTDPNNCGGCAMACGAIPNGIAGCSGGACRVAECNAPFGDCDGKPANGCEVNISTDPNNCGGCGKVCLNTVCNAGACSSLSLAGSFVVDQGPPWSNNPPTYTCQEACALLFGGMPNQYSCSTVNSGVDHLAYVDSWGATSPCLMNPVAENYKLNTNYNCGAVNCSYSAYVNDHSCAATNYCWH
jgi:hypothetical protein